MSTSMETTDAARSSQSSLTAAHGGNDLEKGPSRTTADAPIDEKSAPTEAAATSSPAPHTIPDGGLWAWLNVLGAWLVLGATFGYVSSFGVYQSYYAFKLFPEKSSSDISWLGSVQLFFQFALGAVAGQLFDKGYFRHLLAAGSALCVFSLFMLSLCTKYYQAFLAQAIGIGLANGLLFLPAVTVQSHWWMKRRALAMGFVVTGSSVGGIYYPILLNNLFEKKGFEYGVRTSAYVVLASLLIANLIMKPRYPPKRVGVAKPSPKTFFKEKAYPVAIAGSFFTTLGIFFPIFYIQVYAEVLGVSSNLAFYTIAILNAASVIGRTLPNGIADKIGTLNTICPLVFLNAILIFAIFGVKNSGGIIAISILYGFSSGSYVSLIAPLYAGFAKHPSEIGIRMGLAFLFVSVAALVGTPITGALLTRTHDKFYGPIIFSGICVILGGCFLTAARFLTAREKATWKV